MDTIQTLTINPLPAKTYRWLHVNSTDVKVLPTQKEIAYEVLGASVVNALVLPFESAMGKDSDSIWPATNVINIEGSQTITIICHVESAEAQSCAFQFQIKENAHATVNMLYVGTEHAQAAIRSQFKLNDSSSVKLIQVSLLPQSAVLFNDISTVCESSASFETVQSFLGAKKTYAAARVELLGNKSNYHASLAYFGNADRQFDFNYVVSQIGKNTESLLEVEGVLDQEARKTFRGTIDFIKGSSGSVGTETENVLMLGDGAVNQTIPLILCAEEDVKGNHGATIGNLDPDAVFYMASRGLAMDEIRYLLIKAKMDTILHKIEDENVLTQAENYLSEVLS